MKRRAHATTVSLLLAAAALCACGDVRPTANATQTGCATCHGFPPDSGAHLAHVQGGVFGKQLACLQCHKDVHRTDEPDHILRADGTPVPPPAEVRFDDPGSLAGKNQAGATRAAPPGFDRATATCSNIYCHGSGGTLKGATTAVVAALPWKAKGGAGCGSCHGIPPADDVHASITSSLQCVRCHAGTIDAQGNLSPALHINGTVDLAR
jgi:predicted CxxxxCH...CXXCH cytochrome family protein